jgi:hypothetical protein
LLIMKATLQDKVKELEENMASILLNEPCVVPIQVTNAILPIPEGIVAISTVTEIDAILPIFTGAVAVIPPLNSTYLISMIPEGSVANSSVERNDDDLIDFVTPRRVFATSEIHDESDSDYNTVSFDDSSVISHLPLDTTIHDESDSDYNTVSFDDSSVISHFPLDTTIHDESDSDYNTVSFDDSSVISHFPLDTTWDVSKIE